VEPRAVQFVHAGAFVIVFPTAVTDQPWLCLLPMQLLLLSSSTITTVCHPCYHHYCRHRPPPLSVTSPLPVTTVCHHCLHHCLSPTDRHHSLSSLFVTTHCLPPLSVTTLSPLSTPLLSPPSLSVITDRRHCQSPLLSPLTSHTVCHHCLSPLLSPPTCHYHLVCHH
jgi:hypothetical protein